MSPTGPWSGARTRPERWRPAMIGAMAALLAALATSVWRSHHVAPASRGKIVWSVQEPHVSLTFVRFEWEAIPGADAYDVEITDQSLNYMLLHSASVTTPTITVDRSAFSATYGSRLVWRVRALHAGDVVSTSPPAPLVLR